MDEVVNWRHFVYISFNQEPAQIDAALSIATYFMPVNAVRIEDVPLGEGSRRTPPFMNQFPGTKDPTNWDGTGQLKGFFFKSVFLSTESTNHNNALHTESSPRAVEIFRG